MAISFQLWVKSHRSFKIFYSVVHALSDYLIRFEKFEGKNFAERAFFRLPEMQLRSFARMFPRLKMISGLYSYDLKLKI